MTGDETIAQADMCPPLYVPTRSECDATKAQARRQLLDAGLSPTRWDFEGMGCSHGDGPGDHIEDLPSSEPASAVGAVDGQAHAVG